MVQMANPHFKKEKKKKEKIHCISLNPKYGSLYLNPKLNNLYINDTFRHFL
jgi:hypothetical protein